MGGGKESLGAAATECSACKRACRGGKAGFQAAEEKTAAHVHCAAAPSAAQNIKIYSY